MNSYSFAPTVHRTRLSILVVVCSALFFSSAAGEATPRGGNQPPVVLPDQQFSIKLSEVVDAAPLGTVLATDDQGDPVSFRLSGDDQTAYFAIDDRGVISIADHHVPVGTFRVTVSAVDGEGLVGKADVFIEVAADRRNLRPQLVGGLLPISFDDVGDGREITTISATDPDWQINDAPLRFSIHHIERNGGGMIPGSEQDIFAIDERAGQLTFANAEGVRPGDDYLLHIGVADQDGGTGLAHFTLSVRPGNAPALAARSFAVTEGSSTGTSVGTITAQISGTPEYRITGGTFLAFGNPPPPSDSHEDPAYDAAEVFRINPTTGKITVGRPKYLLATLSPIQITVQATNGRGATAFGSVTVTVQDMHVAINESYPLSWSTVAEHPRGHSEGTGGAVGGKLYAFGGFGVNFAPKEDVHVYDAGRNGWSPLTDMPPMASNSGAGGATHMGWTTDGTDIYIAAGYAANADGTRQQFGATRVYRYNVEANNYTELERLPVDRSAGELEYIDGKLYYVAGTNRRRNEDQGDLFILDLSNRAAGWRRGARMPNPRNHLGSAVLDGKLYILGGQKEHDGKLVPQDDVHAYDPATDTWAHVTDMPKPFNHIHSSVFAYGEYIYSVGGQIDHGGGSHDDVFAYRPSTDRWIGFTNLPGNRMATIADVIDGKLYASGGNNSRKTFMAALPPQFVVDESPPKEEWWMEAECAQVGSRFTTAPSARASNAEYVWSPHYSSTAAPPPSPAVDKVVRYTLEDAVAGDYVMNVRLEAPNSRSDSYWVRVNDGTWQRWWRGLTTWSRGFLWKRYRHGVRLRAGTNTIEFAAREAGIRMDKIHVARSVDLPEGFGSLAANCNDGNNCNERAPTVSTYSLEAECAEVGSTFITSGHRSASNDRVVYQPHDYATGGAPADLPANRVRFNLEGTEAGDYHLFARCRGDGSSFNTYWVRVNEGTWHLYVYRTTDPSGLVWAEVYDGATRLTAGCNTIDFAYREPNTYLDKIHLNKSGNHPQSAGPAATNCPQAGRPASTTPSGAPPTGHSLAVYPNPVAARLNFELNTEYRGTVRTRVSSLSGSMVRSGSYHKATDRLVEGMPIGGLTPGTYVFQVIFGKETRQKLFVKIK